MDDSEYKRLVSAPDVMGCPALRATQIRLLASNPELAAAVERVLRSTPVPKPQGHRGGSDSDFLYLDLSEAEIDAIHDALRDQETFLCRDDERSPERSFVAQLADRWNEADSSRSDAV